MVCTGPHLQMNFGIDGSETWKKNVRTSLLTTLFFIGHTTAVYFKRQIKQKMLVYLIIWHAVVEKYGIPL